MTPKILHLYWGKNQPLSFLRFLTVHSFIKHNPEWEVKLWTPLVTSNSKPWTTGEQVEHYQGKDYLLELKQYIHLVDFDKLKLSNQMPEVHKSDMLRWFLLGSYGGVWADIDILFIKPMPKETELWHGAGLCKYRAIPAQSYEFLAIGFMSSSGLAGKMFFMEIFQAGLDKYISQPKGYQAFGAELLRSYLKTHLNDGVHYLPPSLVYPYYQHSQIKKYWSKQPLPTKDVIGYHWYAGMPLSGQIEAEVTPDNLESYAKSYVLCKEAWNIWT